MPNLLAYIVLALWPLATVAIYRSFGKERALIWSIMGAYLFLPENPATFDFPLMPPLNKHTIPALAAFAVSLWIHGKPRSFLPESYLARALLMVFIFSPIVTVFNNHEPVFFGLVGLPGLAFKDAIALVLQQFLLILPFMMARQFLASGGAQRELLLALVWGGLVYSLLMLIEMRLSPQLNYWIYGYYQHIFGQTVRFGGYRPIVFLYHGLWVSFFMMTALIAAIALWRQAEGKTAAGYFMAALYLGAILVMARSLGAIVFAAMLVPLVVLLGRTVQIKAALVIGALAIGYPTLKGADLVPQERLLERAAQIDPQRAGSLRFRFDNEQVLLDRAAEKPLFGWGSWGRNHILDPVSGQILTVTDGRWIIVMGVYGWAGFLAEFGLLFLPVLLLWRESIARRQDPVSPLAAPLSLLLAINALDMVPNATLTPLTWLLAGALMGYAEQLRAERLRQGFAIGSRWQSVM